MAGTFVFGISGGMAAVRHGLDVFGAITGIGGGMVRDILVREIPEVLRGGLYAVPALLGATIVVIAYRAGDHSTIFPIAGAAVCFGLRMAALRYDLNLPAAEEMNETVDPRRLRRRQRRSR